MPTLNIIAGPNGVGKTTFADEYLPDEIKQLDDRARFAEIQKEAEFEV